MSIVSKEQKIIFQHVIDGFNVCIDAIPGSGKSTSMLTLSQLIPDKNILHITYNSMLRKEFKEKTETMNISNIEVHTYHSFAVKYFAPSAYTDTGLRKVLNDKTSPYLDLPQYDILVLDEAQDQSILYFHFVLHFLSFFKSKIQLIVLGDYMQNIYQFKGANSKFLTMAEKIWQNKPFLSSSVFHQCHLTMSYRITNQMAKYINNSMLTDNRLNACRDGQQVEYIRNSVYATEKIVVNIIKNLLDQGDLPSDIFILAGSVKGTNSNVRRIENSLTQMGIPCFIPNNVESTKVDERVVDGKVVFSTFHTVKGLQRKHVFVVGFDDSYFKFMGKDLDKETCPNTLFVAATRATHKLYLLENNSFSTDKPLTFLRMSHFDMKRSDFVNFKGLGQTIFYDDPPTTSSKNKTPIRNLTVTDLVKFIPEYIIDHISPIIENIFIDIATKENMTNLEEEIPSIIKFNSGLYEDMSDINGICIPSLYFDHIIKPTSYTPLYILIEEEIQRIGNEHPFLKTVFEELNPLCVTISDYLYMSNVYFAMKEKLYFKLKQIDKNEYNWLTKNVVDKCKLLLDYYVASEVKYNDSQELDVEQEKTIIHCSSDEEHLNIDDILSKYISQGEIPDAKYRFTGRIDIMTTESIWELKCCSEISLEHKIQVIIYAFLWKSQYPLSQKKFKILNIKTGECLLLTTKMNILTELMICLIKGKYSKPKIMTDCEFLQSIDIPLQNS
jgi:hypothetical protein